MKQAFLLCQGEQSRMEGVLGCPKQLFEIAGQPIAARTIEILREAKVWDITVVAPATSVWSRFAEKHRVLHHTQTKMVLDYLDILRNLRPFFRTPEIVVLHGDVVFSRAVLKGIVWASAPAAFAMRFDPNLVTGRSYAEMYGFSFAVETLNRLLENPWMSPYHKIRECFDLMHATVDVGTGKVLIVPAHDYTDDLDTPDDLAHVGTFEAAIAHEGKL